MTGLEIFDEDLEKNRSFAHSILLVFLFLIVKNDAKLKRVSTPFPYIGLRIPQKIQISIYYLVYFFLIFVYRFCFQCPSITMREIQIVCL
jgi:hypothetical protein